jgi:hypothetical protein
MDFTPHEQRVIDEHRDLTEKLNKLRAFFDTPTFRLFTEAEQMRMRAQAGFMDGYQNMLRERISAFMAVNAARRREDASPTAPLSGAKDSTNQTGTFPGPPGS